MVLKFNFPFNCSCGRAGNCLLLDDPSIINQMHLAPDCLSCGNTIVITPLRQLDDGGYEYNVRVCKTESEAPQRTPIR